MKKKKTYSVEEVIKLINHLFENSDKTTTNINLSNNVQIKEIENKEKIKDDFKQKEEDQEILMLKEKRKKKNLN